MDHLHIKLVKGNHDILKEDWYAGADVAIIEEKLTIGNFCFTHEHCTGVATAYTFCGHIHPGIVVNGPGKQSLLFPCFYFTTRYCILPAFGTFTGTVAVQPNQHDTVYAIVENALIKLQ